METILASPVFDHFDKTYLLDRLKGSGTGPVVRITETVHNGTRRGRYVVEIDATVLEHIQQFLEAPVPPAPTTAPPRKRPFFTGEHCDAMKKSYLKGVTSEALAVQYDCKAVDIEDVLRKEGIEVVDQSPPTWRNYQHNGGASEVPQPMPMPTASTGLGTASQGLCGVDGSENAHLIPLHFGPLARCLSSEAAFTPTSLCGRWYNG